MSLVRNVRHLKGALLTALLTASVAGGLSGCLPIVAAGAGAGALMATDRRSSGAYVDDEAFEWKIEGQISDRLGDRVHVNAVSFNRVVLLTGEAPDQAVKDQLTRIAQANANVRNVVNDVVVGPNNSFNSRSNDVVITSKVKARFVDEATFGVAHVKVFTEAGTVFLMGLVTRPEADRATEIARTTSGVRKVVRVFEYIPDDEARRLDARAEEGQPAPH
jgi:osmotically-inducible protein OsmY